MAEGIFNHLTKGRHKAFSAGISLAKEINPLAVEVMREIGVDISGQKPKMLDHKLAKEVDKVISMGCINGCPVIKIDEDWQIEDPKGKAIDKFRQVKDIIYSKVEELIQRLDNEKC